MSIDITLSDIAPSLIGNTVITTLTNHGYLIYTLNMLKSLKPFGLDKIILIVTLDKNAYLILKKMGYNTICIDNEEYPISTFETIHTQTTQSNRYLNKETLNKFYPWNTQGYDKVCYYKLELIYRILSLNKNILMIDGDIVFQNNPLLHIQEWNDASEDVWVQNDAPSDKSTVNMCTGYIFIRTSPKLIDLYDCISKDGIEKYKKCAYNNNDQTYFNIYVKPFCTMKALPLALYPNGNIFYYMPELKDNSILVHFNWAKGHEKMAKMKAHKMWLLTPEEEIF
jgi:hypothetical protein